MANAVEKPATPDDAVRNYTVVSVFALVVVLSVLLHEGRPLVWSLLPVLVGLIAVTTHWRAGPPLMLVTLTSLLVMNKDGSNPVQYVQQQFLLVGPSVGLPPRPLDFADAALCVATLAYVVAHYRVISLVAHVFPPDPRRREWPGRKRPNRPSVVEQPRSAGLVEPRELTGFLLGLPVCTGLAFLACFNLWYETPAAFNRSPGIWRGLVLVCALTLVTALVSAILRYLGQLQSTVEENQLFLQDQLWRETRREQSRLNRWLGWARRRGQRRKERGR
jgi:hypothetical protein